MSSLSSDITVTPQDLFSAISNTSGTVPYNTGTPQLGVRAVTGDGREFRYVQAGATALVVGKLYSTAAQVTNHHRLATTGGAIGATTLSVTLGGTAATLNQYLGGWAIVETDSGGTPGYQYQIASNPAQATTNGTLVLTLNDPLLVAISASATITLIPNTYSGVIISASSATGAPVGGAIFPVTASYYGWVQTEGAACILSDGAITVGVAVVKSSSVAGAVAALSSTLAPVGVAMETTVDTDYGMFKLQID